MLRGEFFSPESASSVYLSSAPRPMQSRLFIGPGIGTEFFNQLRTTIFSYREVK
jgi:hypothetical protein